ncbi:hypothetical protein G6F57_023419 [Rhizopus arrhizus]|nr:hypothetical protein G6F59_018942 [Rhizopus arrhizus]KAG1424904.1 hypothetical protein G6F57_023419 [Rhizopus arrhizus]
MRDSPHTPKAPIAPPITATSKNAPDRRAPMRKPENNRNMLPFPVDTPVYGGQAAIIGAVVQPQTGGNNSGPGF